MRGLALTLALLLIGGCAQTPTAAPNNGGATPQASSILAGSTPADGSTVAGPVNNIQLLFDPPARLGEVTVSGPDGMMPMMVTAVGEVRSYTIPAPGLGAGAYRVDWRASIGSTAHHGSFRFAVR